MADLKTLITVEAQDSVLRALAARAQFLAEGANLVAGFSLGPAGEVVQGVNDDLEGSDHGRHDEGEQQ